MLTLEELKKLTLKELEEEFAKATKELFKSKFEINTGTSKASHKIRNLRKYRARIKTLQKQAATKQEAKKDS
jgi:ribosomal protein L29